MGACKSRMSKTTKMSAQTETVVEPRKGQRETVQLRSDAQSYVPAKQNWEMFLDQKQREAAEPEVKESWEIFLDQKKRDLARQRNKQFNRQSDGSYTQNYRNLLTTRPSARGASADRDWRAKSDFDVRREWRSTKLSRPEESPQKAPLKKKKPSTLKKAILAQREAANPLWQKFDEYAQKLNAKSSDESEILGAIEKETKGVQDDGAAGSALVPFGLADRCYLSDSEDHAKAHRHREASHAPVREFVDLKLTAELEESVVRLLFTLRQLRIQDAVVRPTRRYAVGIREVSRLLSQKAVACLVVAPDLEQTGGVLEGKIAALVKICDDQSVPVVYALSRRQLGAAIQKNVAISVLAVQDVRGAGAEFAQMLDEASKARGLAVAA